MNDNWGFSDEELDGLFRQAADGQRPRFEPEDWRRMAARLDEAGRDGTLPPPARPWYQRWGWLGLLGLALLTGLTVWLTAGSEKAAPVRRETTVAPRPATSADRSAPATGATAPARAETEPAAPQREIAADRANAAEPTRTAPQPGREAATSETTVGTVAEPKKNPENRLVETGAKPNGVVTSRSRTPLAATSAAGKRERTPNAAVGEGRTGMSPTAFSRKRDSRNRKPAVSPDQTATVLTPTRRRTVPARNQNLPKNQERMETSGPAPLPAFRTDGQTPRTGLERTAENRIADTRSGGQPATSQPSEAAPEATTDRWATENLALLKTRRVSFRKINLPVEEPDLGQSSSYYTPPARRAEVAPRGRLGVRALLAPDLNAVSALRTFAYGRSLGLLAEYEVAPRWRVQAGAIRSQKDYTSTPDDYTPPTPGYWQRYGKPETIDARCSILDVPLNVRFDAFRRPRHDLFVSTGLSTYVMLDEAYDYHYASRPMYSHQYRRSGRHLASTLNLSAGYERQLGAGFSLQVEPYLKLPLAGVGWGSVRLYSTGLHLSLGFHRIR